MALIKCPECGGTVSDKAPACIHCGYPLQETKPSSENTVNNYNIILIEKGRDDSYVIRRIREFTGYGLGETVNLLNNLPCAIIKNIPKETANALKEKIQAKGAVVKIEAAPIPQEKPLCCPRCGSQNVTTGKRGYSIVTGFLGSNKTTNRCGKCGYSWQPR